MYRINRLDQKAKNCPITYSKAQLLYNQGSVTHRLTHSPNGTFGFILKNFNQNDGIATLATKIRNIPNQKFLSRDRQFL